MPSIDMHFASKMQNTILYFVFEKHLQNVFFIPYLYYFLKVFYTSLYM